MNTYTVIVGRPDHISDDPVSDTYITRIQAENADKAGDAAMRECAAVDAGDKDTDPDGYVVVAVIAGKHTDIQGRTDV